MYSYTSNFFVIVCVFFILGYQHPFLKPSDIKNTKDGFQTPESFEN